MPRILIVDDEPMICRLVRRVLERSDCEVECACSGDLAIELYLDARDQGRPFDLLILDLSIPGGLGGQATIEQLLRHDPTARAIVSSGHLNDPSVLEPEKHGFVGALLKPFDASELRRMVGELTSRLAA